MKLNKVLIAFGLLSLSTMALAYPGFNMTVGFANLTQDTITLKAISASHCVNDENGIFAGNILTLQPADFDYTTNNRYNTIGAKTSLSGVYICSRDPHRVTLQLSYPTATGQKNFSFNIYIPTTHGNGTRGVLSFKDQEKGAAELNFQNSGQTTVSLPYNLQIQAANSALNPIIYIYSAAKSLN